MSEFAIQEMDDHWILPLEGKRVLRCYVDHAFGIELGSASTEVTIRIECPFEIIEEGRRMAFVPEEKLGLGNALTIFDRTVNLARVYKNGHLELRLSGDCVVHVSADPRYEAWELSEATTGCQIVASPGGELAIWRQGGTPRTIE